MSVCVIGLGPKLLITNEASPFRRDSTLESRVVFNLCTRYNPHKDKSGIKRNSLAAGHLEFLERPKGIEVLLRLGRRNLPRLPTSQRKLGPQRQPELQATPADVPHIQVANSRLLTHPVA